jgi:hypothetical protein
LSCDLNTKYPFWNTVVSDTSREKLLNLFEVNELEISAPQRPTDYAPVGSDDMLDIVVPQNIRLSGMMDSHHLPTVFRILGHVNSKNLSVSAEIFLRLATV